MKTAIRSAMFGLALFASLQAPTLQLEAAVGAQASTWTLRPPSGVRGSAFRLSDHLNAHRPVVMLFWDTTCAPCLQEMQFYQTRYAHYGASRLAVVAIALDNGQTISNAANRVRTLNLTYPVVWDENSTVKNQFQVPANPPFSVWIDRNGRIVRERQGYSVSENSVITTQLENLVNGRAVQ